MRQRTRVHLAVVVVLVTAVVVPTVLGAAPVGAATAPSTVTAIPGDGFVDVTWSRPTTASTITEFRIERFTGAAATPDRTDVVAADVVRRRFFGLDADQTYRFRVSTRDASGWSAPSATTAAVGPAALGPFSTVDDLATQLHLDLFARAVTPAEVSAARSALGGTTSVGAYVLARSRTVEAKPLQAIARIYLAYFQRPPDTSGFGYWVGKLRGGTRLEAASSSFAGSSEFARTYGSLTNRQFVDLVYRNVLGRGPDAAGLSYWTGQLDRRLRSRGAVMTQFSESSENVRKKGEEVDAVLLRWALLHATPKLADFTAAVTRLEGGTAAEVIAQELFDSDALLTRFGRQPGAPLVAPGSVRPTYSGTLYPQATELRPDGRYAFTSSSNGGSLRVFDVRDARFVASFPADAYRGVAMAPSGHVVAFVGPTGRTLEVLDTRTLEVVRSVPFTAPDAPLAFDLAADDRALVALYDGSFSDAYLLDLASGDRTLLVEDLRDPVVQVDASGTRALIFDGGAMWPADLQSMTVGAKRYPIAEEPGTVSRAGASGFSIDREWILDGTGTVTARVVDEDDRGPLAVAPDGARGYRFSGPTLQVLDLRRGLANRSLPVPDYGPTISSLDVDVSADGTVVVGTMLQGMVVAGAPSALVSEPVPTPRSEGSRFIPTAGQVGEVKVSDVEVAPDSATVWAVNQGLNQIEVFDAQTLARLSVVRLPAAPSDLDFAPDGTKAYVVGPGSGEIVVIGTASRTVVDRIPIPAASGFWGRPDSLAVAGDGRILVSRIANEGQSPATAYLTAVDPATRQEVPGFGRPVVGAGMRMAASGDRAKVLVSTSTSTGRWYLAATHAFTPLVVGANFTYDAPAVDQDGDRVFAGRRVLDGDLAPIAAINTPAALPYFAGISPDGSTGYRVEGSGTVRVMDLDAAAIVRTVLTGDPGAKHDGRHHGLMDVSADGHVVAIVTAGGLSILRDP